MRLSACVLSLLFAVSTLVEAVRIPTPPDVEAGGYILMDALSGRVLAEKNADLPLPPASLTKIMTSYVTAQELSSGRVKEGDLVRVSRKARSMQGSRTFLEEGSRVPVLDVLRGLIIQSGNDAAVALAEHISGTEQEYVQMMNAYAEELKMHDTLYQNASGYPQDNHYTTAQDQALLARAIINRFPAHYRFYRERSFTWNDITQSNRNRLLWHDPSVDGVKTGHTEAAGYCLVASAKRNNTRLISVVMQANSERERSQASQALLNYGFRHYETRQVATEWQQLGEMELWLGAQDMVKVGLDTNAYALVPRRVRVDFKYDYTAPQVIRAPLKKGDKLGTVKVMLAGDEVAELVLVAVEVVPEAGWLGYTLDYIGLFVYQLVYGQ